MATTVTLYKHSNPDNYNSPYWLMEVALDYYDEETKEYQLTGEFEAKYSNGGATMLYDASGTPYLIGTYKGRPYLYNATVYGYHGDEALDKNDVEFIHPVVGKK